VPPSRPAASASGSAVNVPNPKSTVHGPSYVLQVGAMIHEENANALADSMRRMNLPAFVLRTPYGRFHHVFIGPYESKDAATAVKNDLEKRGFQAICKKWTAKTE